MHLLIAKILKFCYSFKIKLLGDKGALQNLAGRGFLNAGSQHIFSLPPPLSEHMHYKKVFTNFFLKQIK